MKYISPFKKLDLVLNAIALNSKPISSKPDIDYQQIRNIVTQYGYNSAFITDLEQIIEKLLDDKLIKKRELEAYSLDYKGNKQPANYVGYSITFEGQVLYKSGGYEKRNKRANQNSKRIEVLNWAVAIGGGAAAVYYFLEIAIFLKHHLFHGCFYR